MIFRFKWFQQSLILNFKQVCNLEPEFHFDQQQKFCPGYRDVSKSQLTENLAAVTAFPVTFTYKHKTQILT